MSFIRAKEIPPRSGNWYDYEVATVHIDGKTIQKHIQYLGKRGKHNKPLIGDKVDMIRLPGLFKPIMGNNYQKPRVTYLNQHRDLLPLECRHPPHQVTDYIAVMTDHYALRLSRQLGLP